MPDRIEATPEGLAYLDALIAEGKRLLEDDSAVDWSAMPCDESDREASIAEKRPIKRLALMDYAASITLKTDDYGAWYGAAFAMLESVCGKEHPWPKSFEKLAYGAVRGCVSGGQGVLRAFRLAWPSGFVWSVGQ